MKRFLKTQFYFMKQVPVFYTLLGLLVFGLLSLDSLQAQKVAYNQPDSFRVMSEARAHISQLCSADMNGRGYIENGHEKAALYLTQAFTAYKLKPWRPDSAFPKNYFQYFDFNVNLIETAELTLDSKRMVIGGDYIVASNSAAADGSYDLVDLGYGLADDWKNNKVKNKAVLIRSGVPEDFKGTEDEKKMWGSDDMQIQAAIEYKASAIIIVHKRLTASFSEKSAKIPILLLADSSLKDMKPQKVRIQVVAKERKLQSQNVVGWMKGTKVPDTAIVICGHYDHLGQQGSALFAGANDNASGIAFILSLAQYYGENPPDYSLVFIAFSAEEAGLHGSTFHAGSQPFWPIDKTKLVLNFDLLGSGDDGVMMVGGKTWPEWYTSMTALNDSLHRLPKIDSRPNAPISDHYPFTQRKVPGLFFYAQGGAIHYHDIRDLPDQLTLTEFYDFRNLMIEWIQTFSQKKP